MSIVKFPWMKIMLQYSIAIVTMSSNKGPMPGPIFPGKRKHAWKLPSLDDGSFWKGSKLSHNLRICLFH